MNRRAMVRRRRMARRGVFLLPSLLTTANLFCGFASIVMSFQRELRTAAVLIIVAAVLDGLDGRIARLTRATSQFGGEYDSLADVLSFGLAPAFLVHVWGLGPLGRYGWGISFLFLVCGAVRLARFNVQHGASDRRWFVGLPVPMAAAPVAASVLQFEGRIEDPTVAAVVGGLTLVVSILMVSRVRYRSFKDFDLRSRHPFRLVVTIAVVIAAIALHPHVVLFACTSFYALSGPTGFLVGLLRGARRGEPSAQGLAEER